MAKKKYCEVCNKNKPEGEGKWGRYCLMWVCNSCIAAAPPPDDDEDAEEWLDSDD